MGKISARFRLFLDLLSDPLLLPLLQEQFVPAPVAERGRPAIQWPSGWSTGWPGCPGLQVCSGGMVQVQPVASWLDWPAGQGLFTSPEERIWQDAWKGLMVATLIPQLNGCVTVLYVVTTQEQQVP